MYFFGVFFFLWAFFFYQLLFYFSMSPYVFNWLFFSWGGLDLGFSFMFDGVSLGFFGVVSFISGMVFMYSIFYMEGEVNLRRFCWLVFGFVFSMGLLVFSGNFFTLMVGWDGLGLISFCLVVFYSNYSSLESGLITVLSNRVGDLFFLLCFFLFFLGDFGLGSVPLGLGVLFSGFLFFGSITKSAQVPFSAWLPAAMAAPTPVSSLVHSSTLVTAGVYVILRFYYVFLVLDYLFVKGLFIFTMVVSGFCACIEKDFKKIVAMSTLSQLGLMMFVLSLGLWFVSFFHLIIHAFFKSMLFLNTGYLMHGYGGGQDSRFYGGDFFSFGVFLCFFVSSFCLMGFPFYIGFYSKDLILLSSSYLLGSGLYYVFLGGCVLTVYYSFRLIYGCFCNGYAGFTYSSYQSGWVFMVSVTALFFFGWLLGNCIYWSLLFSLNILGSGVDFLVGLSLILTVSLFFSFIFFIYRFLFYFMAIYFMRWFGGSGTSFSFKGLSYFRWDFSWLELSGGQGVSNVISISTFLDFYKFLSLGFMFVFFFGLFCI